MNLESSDHKLMTEICYCGKLCEFATAVNPCPLLVMSDDLMHDHKSLFHDIVSVLTCKILLPDVLFLIAMLYV